MRFWTPWFYNAFDKNTKKKIVKRIKSIIFIFTCVIHKKYYVKTNYTLMAEDPKS